MDEKDVDIGKRLVQQKIKRDTDDVVYIDHRQSGCLAEEPTSQGGCFASNAFTTISFYEWIFCKKTGEFQAFSEQYIIDCGYRLGTGNCDVGTGDSAEALKFVDDFGLVYRENYPYTGEQGICPYDDSVSFEDMSSVSIEEHSVTYIPLDRLAEYLKYGPVIVTIKISNEFPSYAGGFDDNVGHDPELMHTMLLIGHGGEDGKGYWLLRNSLSTAAGDGLYKLNKNVDCLRGWLSLFSLFPAEC